jgi:hypothetical protein
MEKSTPFGNNGTVTTNFHSEKSVANAMAKMMGKL